MCDLGPLLLAGQNHEENAVPCPQGAPNLEGEMALKNDESGTVKDIVEVARAPFIVIGFVLMEVFII